MVVVVVVVRHRTGFRPEAHKGAVWKDLLPTLRLSLLINISSMFHAHLSSPLKCATRR